MNPTSRILGTPTRAALLLAAFFLAAGTALAIEPPPQEPDEQRAWLVGHLLNDMQALGTFDEAVSSKVPRIIDRLDDDQVGLLAQYWYLTRAKTLQDAGLYAMQERGDSGEEVNEAKAEIADLLTTMHDEIVACREQFAPMPGPALWLADICYAAVPGWCCGSRCFVPSWYYDNGYFVGPCFDSAYAGPWAVPVCAAYYDHGSGFYGRYYNVAKTVHVNRSVNLARRQADWLRHHGDWKDIVRHDRLLHHDAKVSHDPSARLAAPARNRLANYASPARAPRAAAAHGGRELARSGNRTAQASPQAAKSHANHALAARPSMTQRDAAKANASRAVVSHPPKARNAAEPHVSASHARAPRPAAHAASSRPAAHAPKAKPAAHAPPHPQQVAQARSGQGRHKP